MNDTTETILMEALDLLEQGMGAEEIVTRYPGRAAELRPFLLTASALTTLAHQPPLVAQAQSKRVFLESTDLIALGNSRSPGGRLRRLVASALAVLLVLLLGGAGLVSASSAAVPGDALYPTKRWAEDVRLNLTANSETAAALREQFRQERIGEVEQLLADGRAAAVSLSGRIDAMDGGRWLVAGVPVLVAPVTAIDGRPVVGALVRVDGMTGDQGVIANRVSVLAAVPMPEPAPTETPAPRPTGDGAPGVLPPGQPIASPTATSPTATPVVRPTDPPASTPQSPTATPDDDDDDDGTPDSDDGTPDGDDDGTPGSDDDATPDDGDDDGTPGSDDDATPDNGDDDGTPDSDDDATPDDGDDDGTPDSDDDATPDDGDDDGTPDSDDDATPDDGDDDGTPDSDDGG